MSTLGSHKSLLIEVIFSGGYFGAVVFMLAQYLDATHQQFDLTSLPTSYLGVLVSCFGLL